MIDKVHTGYTVSIKNKIGSSEAYYKSPTIGYFHPIQTYYIGELLEKVQTPAESDHKLVWMRFDDLKGKMYLDMQSWALELVQGGRSETLQITACHLLKEK